LQHFDEEAAMANRDDEFRRGIERPQFSAYDGTGEEHGEPREYHFGSGFEKPERGRWSDQHPVDVYSQPYDRWSNPGYVFYAGKGHHREFIDPYVGSIHPEAGRGGLGFQVVRERRLRGGPFVGRGPKGYVRSDERIWEDVNERLREHGETMRPTSPSGSPTARSRSKEPSRIAGRNGSRRTSRNRSAV
jgi:hypothetical protein